MPLILPGNVASATAGAYSIQNSCRFNGSSQGLVRTNPSSSPTLGTKSTVSFWSKRTEPNSTGTNQFFQYTNGGSSPYNQMYWKSTGHFQWQNHDTTTNTSLITNQKFMDCSAWYHMVFSYDSTPSTPSSSSVKMFVNGVQVTSFSDETYPSQNVVSQVCKPSVNFPIGYYPSTAWYSGYYAELMVVDGQALNAYSFGEFDSDSPTIWKPIDISGINVGNLGCYLEFKDSAELGVDTSGVGNFTETALTAVNQSTDTPTNNFCVINPLDNYYAGSTISQGNCKIVGHASRSSYNTGTIGLSAGKWYWEIKQGVVAGTGSEYYAHVGIETIPSTSTSNSAGINTYSSNYSSYDGDHYHDTGGSGNNDDFGDTYTDGDIISVALDLDNNKVYYAKNGTWQNSQDPTDGTNALTITAPASTDSGVYFPAIGDRTAAKYYTWEANFGGCPAFTVSSSNADDNGYGNFEYDVPAGYLAICTKNLGSDGG